MMRRWLRNTAILALLAVVAVLLVKLAQPWLVDAPLAPPAEAEDAAA